MSIPPGTSSVAPAGSSRRSAQEPEAQPIDVPDVPGVARVIAIANQKGGVGKSTTAVSLGAAMAELGYRVLVVDLDPQGNASTGLGIRHEARDVTVYDVIVSEAALDEAVIPTPLANLFALPSTIDLAGAEIELVSQFSRESRLKKALEPVRSGTYDFILLDCPPSLGLLTINALTAAEELIVPIQCEYYALEGLGQLLRNVTLVQQNINPGLRVTGIVLTMFDPRTKLSEQVVEEVRRFFGELVYDVVIPRTVRLSEAPGFGQPITVYDPRSKGAESYRELAREVAVRPAPTGPMPVYDELPTVVVGPLEATAASSPADDPTPVDPDESVTETSAAAAAATVDVAAAPSLEEVAPPEPKAGAEPFVAADASEVDPPASQAPAESALPPSPPPSPPSPPPAPPVAAVRDVEPGATVVEAPASEEEIWEESERAPESRVRAASESREPGHLPERRVVVIDEQAEAELTTTPTAMPPPAQGESTDAADDASAAIGATLDDGKPPVRRRRWRLFRKGG